MRPPEMRGSTKVPRPTRDRCPGLPAAMSRNRCEMTPCGRFQASMRSSTASRLQRRHQAPVAADDARHQALAAEVVEAALLAVALPAGVDQRQPARRGGVDEAALEHHGQVLGEADADEARGGDGVAVGDQRHRRRGPRHLALAPHGDDALARRLGGPGAERVRSWRSPGVAVFCFAPMLREHRRRGGARPWAAARLRGVAEPTKKAPAGSSGGTGQTPSEPGGVQECCGAPRDERGREEEENRLGIAAGTRPEGWQQKKGCRNSGESATTAPATDLV